MTTNNTREIVTLLAVLIIGATMSGCIETRTISTPTVTPTTESIYNSDQVRRYLKTHDLSAGFGDVQIVLHSNGTVTSGDQVGKWLPTGTAENKWRCSIKGIDKVEYLYLYDGRIAEAWSAEHGTLNGVWFR